MYEIFWIKRRHLGHTDQTFSKILQFLAPNYLTYSYQNWYDYLLQGTFFYGLN